MAWRLAKSLVTLRNQVNEAWPNRSKVSDGTIGDTAHSNRTSDHNPNSAGVVCAIDITDDDRVGADMAKVAENLRKSKDARIKYLIHSGRYCSPRTNWQWKPYIGLNDHAKHLHVSVQGVASLYDNTAKWPIIEGDDEVPQFTPEEEKVLKGIVQSLKEEGSNEDSINVMIKMIRWLRTKFAGEAGLP